jgi:coiled-coil domain-containing protein 115
MRYGQDYYDDRMQATRRLYVKFQGFGFYVIGLTNNSWVTDDDDDDDNDVLFPSIVLKSARTEMDSGKPDVGSTATMTDDEVNTVNGSNEDGEEEKSVNISESSRKDVNAASDPLRWFGILVPPALRSAQSAFISAMDDPIIRLIASQRAMRQLEIEIQRTRKAVRKVAKG